MIHNMARLKLAFFYVDHDFKDFPHAMMIIPQKSCKLLSELFVIIVWHHTSRMLYLRLSNVLWMSLLLWTHWKPLLLVIGEMPVEIFECIIEKWALRKDNLRRSSDDHHLKWIFHKTYISRLVLPDDNINAIIDLNFISFFHLKKPLLVVLPFTRIQKLYWDEFLYCINVIFIWIG